MNVPNGFWNLVDIRRPLECWPWKTGKSKGYGEFKVGGKSYLAHRASLYLMGYDVDGQFVCHTCDNPACCNPAHLFLGTTQDNTKDRNAKGRQARGEKQGSAKLTAEDVAEIRKRAANGEPQTWIAQDFKISKSQCGNVVHGRHWRHV